ncbi:MAG: hypothetical protein A4E57_04849 [Syntrophorhabdaceae bacterium PtaU1.Bin034]|nr:MAG: hypothetical protein A4E57_04849 [Syntrophorhabdaceae bacterium PtaU1.Bin034]
MRPIIPDVGKKSIRLPENNTRPKPSCTTVAMKSTSVLVSFLSSSLLTWLAPIRPHAFAPYIQPNPVALKPSRLM